MKLEAPKNEDVQTIAGDFGSTDATITDDSLPYIFDLLSKGLYSNPIGSIVREITSNCFDSHMEAKVDDPVIISHGNDEEGDYVKFKDVGIGLSPMRMLKIYMRYFKSTKRNSDEFIGAFGLGSKSPLSYTDYFYITAWKHGKRYEYLYSKGESVPTLDCLTGNEERIIAGKKYKKNVDGINIPVIPPWKVNWPIGEDDDQRNGSEIKVYLKKYDDYLKFEDAFKTQLSYFDNVYYQDINIDNDYRIYDTLLYKFRSKDHYSDEMHICLGKVSYPIDWKAINVEPIKVPVAVKFEIGELLVTPNRESLRYTDAVKALVAQRVLAVKEQLITAYLEQNKPIEDFREWYRLRASKPFIKFGDQDKLYLTGLEVAKKYKCTWFDGIEIFHLAENHLDGIYKLLITISEGRKCKIASKRSNHITVACVEPLTNGINKVCVVKNLSGIALSGVKSAYFKNGIIVQYVSPSSKGSEFGRTVRDSFIKLASGKLKGYSSYGRPIFGDEDAYFNLGAHKLIYNLIRRLRELVEGKRVMQADGVEDIMPGIAVNYNDVPESFIKEYKAEQERNNLTLQRKKEGKVFVKSLREHYRFYRDTDEFEITLQNIDDYRGIIIYGGRDDKASLQNATRFMSNFKSFKTYEYKENKGTVSSFLYPNYEILMINKLNHKSFNKPKMVHVDNLFSDNVLFRRIASAIKIKNFFKARLQNADVKRNSVSFYIEFIQTINKKIGDDLENLRLFMTDNLNGDEEDMFYIKIQKFAEANNLFDPNIENIFERINIWYNGLDMLDFMSLNEDSLPTILKYIKERGKSINKDYYTRYIVSQGKEINDENSGQIIMLFPEKESEQEEQETRSKFTVLTNRKTA